MADALASPVPTFILGLFDYLTTATIPERLLTPQLLYAGTLTKASWLKTCMQQISVFGKRPRKWYRPCMG
ncbi:Glycosyltransferase (fragment) [Pseudolactococcus piscium]